MKTKTNNMKPKFTTPIHYLTSTDELREVLQYIHFVDGFAVATDAHIGAEMPLEQFGFSAEDIANLNGYSIHRSQFILIKGRELMMGVIEPGVIECYNPSFTVKLRKTENLKGYKIVNDFKNMICTKNPAKELPAIGINPRMLRELTQAMGIKFGVKLEFTGTQGSIIVKGVDSIESEYGTGLIMPVLIDSERM